MTFDAMAPSNGLAMAATMSHTGDMSDLLHDHTTIGFRRGCVACAQPEADFARCSAANRAKLATMTSRA